MDSYWVLLMGPSGVLLVSSGLIMGPSGLLMVLSGVLLGTNYES